jgi:hypothetical protein
MAANTGRTNAKHIEFHLDNSEGTLTELTAYIKSIGTVGVTYEEQDVTAYSDGVKNVTIGRADAPLSVTFQWDTVLFAHLIALSRTTPLSLDIRFGIRHDWEDGEPTFGISSSATSGYLLKDLTATDTEITASFVVFGPTAPGWAIAAHT